MKRIICLILIFFIFPLSAFSAEPIVTVNLNGNVIEFDVPPKLISGRTMVPMRKIYEALGARVEWVEEAQLIVAFYDTDIISMEIGETEFYVTDLVSGETETIYLDVAPFIENEKTFVPVRAVSEVFDKKVEWDDKTYTVIINDNN